jgi:pectate lyase-like protein
MKTVFVPLLLAMATQFARGDYNVRDYGAMGDGVHNDTASIQAAIDACDNAGGGTVFFPTGHYNETGLVVGSSATASNHHQSYVFLEGSAPHAAVLRYVGSTSGIALKFSGTIGGGARRLDIVNTVARGTTDGIQTSGAKGVNGTSTNNCIFEHVGISGFHNGWHTSANGSPTSSEITSINLVLSYCDNGFYNDSFNGLNFTFIQLQTNNNGVGIYAHTAGVYVFGGAASANQTDFRFENGGTDTIHGFRSETAGKFIDDSGPRSLSVLDCIAQALKGPTAITLGGNHISIRDSDIGGDIKVSDKASGAAIDISNTAVQSKSIITIGDKVTNGTYRIFGCWTCVGNFNNITPVEDQQGTFSSAKGMVPTK